MVILTIKAISKIVYAYSKQNNVKYNGAYCKKLEEDLIKQNPKIGKIILDIRFFTPRLKFSPHIYTLCFNVDRTSDDQSIEDYYKQRLMEP